MADLAQLEIALRTADAAGDTAAAQALAGEIVRMRGQSQQQPPAVVVQQPQNLGLMAEVDAIERVQGKSAFSDATNAVLQGIPFSDELLSGVSAPVRAATDWWNGRGFDLGRAYGENQQIEAELRRRREERSPIASIVGNIAGGAALAAPVAKAGFSFLRGASPTLRSMAGRGAAEGAAWGGLYGAGEGEGFEQRAINSGTGALTGSALGGAFGAIGRIGAGKVDTSALPTADELKTAAQAAYQRADNAGVVYSKDAIRRVADVLRGEFADFGYHPELQGGARVALNEINRLADQNVSLKGLDVARKIAGNAYQPGNKANNALTAKVADAIDDLVASPQAGDILMGNAPQAAAALQEARGLYRQASKLETVNNLLERAGLRAASSGSGGNIENTTRQELRKILTSPKMQRGFTKPELDAIRSAVLGSKSQDVLRLVGKLSPEGNGLTAMLHLLGGSATGGATLPAAAVGMAAKRGADAMSRNSTKIVEALIASGGNLPAPKLDPIRKAIVGALARGSSQQLPAYTSR